MATFYTGQAPQAEEMYGLSRVSGVDAIQPFLEQALDPMKVGSGIDLAKYLEGVNITPGGIWGNQAGVDANTQAANTVLSRLYTERPDLFRAGFNPYSSFSDWNARQNTREGFNEGSDLGSFVTGGISHLGDTAGELLQEPGVLALLAAGTGGALMGGAGTAAGTAADVGAFGGLDAGAIAGADYGLSGAATAAAPAAAVSGAASALAPTGGLPGMSQILAGAIPAAFGAYGANQQANAYEGLARDYMNMGAPYRSKLSDLYANPSAFLNSPEVQVPVQQGTNALARALSVNGNPIGSGTALQELQNYSSNQLFSRLGQEKDRLAGFGGLSAYNQAAPQTASNAIGAQKGVYDAIGAGAADIFYPPKRYSLSGLAGLP